MLEGWDFYQTRLKHTFIRTYIAGFLNNIFYAIVLSEIFIVKPYILKIIGHDNDYVMSLAEANKASKTTIRFSNKEQMVATEFLKLVNLFIYDKDLIYRLLQTLLCRTYFRYQN